MQYNSRQRWRSSLRRWCRKKTLFKEWVKTWGQIYWMGSILVEGIHSYDDNTGSKFIWTDKTDSSYAYEVWDTNWELRQALGVHTVMRSSVKDHKPHSKKRGFLKFDQPICIDDNNQVKTPMQILYGSFSNLNGNDKELDRWIELIPLFLDWAEDSLSNDTFFIGNGHSVQSWFGRKFICI